MATATKEITIQGLVFEVTTPYAEGHPCTEAEAKALNQTRAENIGNNMRKAVNDAKNEDGSIDAAKLAELKAAVKDYDKNYEFTLASVGGGRKLDPLEKEAQSIARAHITAALKESGRKVKDVEPEKLKAEIARIAENPKVLELAKKQLAAKQKVRDAEFGDVSI